MIFPALSPVNCRCAIPDVISHVPICEINDTHSIVSALLFVLYRVPGHHSVEDPDVEIVRMGPALQSLTEMSNVPLGEEWIAIAHGQIGDVGWWIYQIAFVYGSAKKT